MRFFSFSALCSAPVQLSLLWHNDLTNDLDPTHHNRRYTYITGIRMDLQLLLLPYLLLLFKYWKEFTNSRQIANSSVAVAIIVIVSVIAEQRAASLP
jgi:hypothetical protein